ncbi:652_t:CDS:2, partial [Gigaspora margarita]
MSATNKSKFLNGRLHYFELFLSKIWSFHHFNSWVFETFSPLEDNEVIFYNILNIIKNDSSTSKRVTKTVNALISKIDCPIKVNKWLAASRLLHLFRAVDKDLLILEKELAMSSFMRIHIYWIVLFSLKYEAVDKGPLILEKKISYVFLYLHPHLLDFRSNSEMSIENDVPSMHSILSNQNENNIK